MIRDPQRFFYKTGQGRGSKECPHTLLPIMWGRGCAGVHQASLLNPAHQFAAIAEKTDDISPTDIEEKEMLRSH